MLHLSADLTSSEAQACWRAALQLGRDLGTAEGPCRRAPWVEVFTVHARSACRYGQGLARGCDLPGEIVSKEKLGDQKLLIKQQFCR